MFHKHFRWNKKRYCSNTLTTSWQFWLVLPCCHRNIQWLRPSCSCESHLWWKKMAQHGKNEKCKSISSKQSDINTIKFHKIFIWLHSSLNAFLSSGVTWYFFFSPRDACCNWQSLAALCQSVLSRCLDEEYKFIVNRRCSTKMLPIIWRPVNDKSAATRA